MRTLVLAVAVMPLARLVYDIDIHRSTESKDFSGKKFTNYSELVDRWLCGITIETNRLVCDERGSYTPNRLLRLLYRVFTFPTKLTPRVGVRAGYGVAALGIMVRVGAWA